MDREQLNIYNDRQVEIQRDDWLNPEPDLPVYCSFCDEEIPSGGYYFRVGEYIYCPDCMDDCKMYVDY